MQLQVHVFVTEMSVIVIVIYAMSLQLITELLTIEATNYQSMKKNRLLDILLLLLYAGSLPINLVYYLHTYYLKLVLQHSCKSLSLLYEKYLNTNSNHNPNNNKVRKNILRFSTTSIGNCNCN